MRSVVLVAIILAGCSSADENNLQAEIPFPQNRPFFEKPKPALHTAMVAFQYLDFGEQTHRAELKKLTGVDPVRTEWCAAFVNAVLRDSGLIGSESVSKYPLTARSFLHWGKEVEEPQTGDIVVFSRGNVSWQGHVGFYFGTITVGKVKYYKILGGNQDNKVSIELYPAHRALSIRREKSV